MIGGLGTRPKMTVASPASSHSPLAVTLNVRTLHAWLLVAHGCTFDVEAFHARGHVPDVYSTGTHSMVISTAATGTGVQVALYRR